MERLPSIHNPPLINNDQSRNAAELQRRRQELENKLKSLDKKVKKVEKVLQKNKSKHKLSDQSPNNRPSPAKGSQVKSSQILQRHSASNASLKSHRRRNSFSSHSDTGSSHPKSNDYNTESVEDDFKPAINQRQVNHAKKETYTSRSAGSGRTTASTSSASSLYSNAPDPEDPDIYFKHSIEPSVMNLYQRPTFIRTLERKAKDRAKMQVIRHREDPIEVERRKKRNLIRSLVRFEANSDLLNIGGLRVTASKLTSSLPLSKPEASQSQGEEDGFDSNLAGPGGHGYPGETSLGLGVVGKSARGGGHGGAHGAASGLGGPKLHGPGMRGGPRPLSGRRPPLPHGHGQGHGGGGNPHSPTPGPSHGPTLHQSASTGALRVQTFHHGDIPQLLHQSLSTGQIASGTGDKQTAGANAKTNSSGTTISGTATADSPQREVDQGQQQQALAADMRKVPSAMPTRPPEELGMILRDDFKPKEKANATSTTTSSNANNADAPGGSGSGGGSGGADHPGASGTVDIAPTLFYRRYRRGELPCAIEHRRGGGLALAWVCPIDALDYEYYLPIFLDGIRCTTDPCKFIARQGLLELVECASGAPGRVIPCIPDLIGPLRLALKSRDKGILIGATRFLRKLVEDNEGVGEALIPYYKHILVLLNAYYTGDTVAIENEPNRFGRRDSTDAVTEVREAFESMEKCSGPDAFVNIKYFVPTYESCLL